MNRVLGDMLRHYAGLQQYRWHERLPAAEFAINNAYQESIGTTPFRLNGRDPNIPMIRPPAKEQSAAHFADRMIEGLQQAKHTQPPPDPVEVDGDIEFFIDHIVSHSENKKTGKRMFKVRWRGYPPEWDDLLDEEAVEDTEAYTNYVRRARNTPRVRDSDDDE